MPKKPEKEDSKVDLKSKIYSFCAKHYTEQSLIRARNKMNEHTLITLSDDNISFIRETSQVTDNIEADKRIANLFTSIPYTNQKANLVSFLELKFYTIFHEEMTTTISDDERALTKLSFTLFQTNLLRRFVKDEMYRIFEYNGRVTKNILERFFDTISWVINKPKAKIIENKIKSLTDNIHYIPQLTTYVDTTIKGFNDRIHNQFKIEKEKLLRELIKQGSSSGWDKDGKLVTIFNDAETGLVDLNKLFKKIRGRTDTRYGYQKGTFLQGPHTVARSFGFNSRLLSFSNIRTYSNSETKELTHNPIERNISNKDLFRHLLNYEVGEGTNPQLTIDGVPIYLTSFSKPENLTKYLNYLKMLKTNLDNQQSTCERVLVYGQILCDLHPFASSFDMSGTGLEGGGEGTNFSQVKWISRISTYYIDPNETVIKQELHLSSKNAMIDENITCLFTRIRGAQPTNPDLINSNKLIFALKYILPSNEDKFELGLSDGNKGLIDTGGFQLISTDFQIPFLKFVIDSIIQNLRNLRFVIHTFTQKKYIVDKVMLIYGTSAINHQIQLYEYYNIPNT